MNKNIIFKKKKKYLLNPKKKNIYIYILNAFN